ncbi:hypothetical protein KCU81_g9645, partial [Aureobasidium melanogenum]
MAHTAKFEVIRTQAVESGETSLNSNTETGDKVLVKPQVLSWWQASRIVGAVLDMLAIALSCAFFVYALAVKMHQNMPMESPQVKILLRLSKLGPTIYPVLFAALIGRALKSIAFWKLQRGSKIGTLDRVLGSMTIVQTVLTQVQMRSLSLLGFLLIVIWSLSPLGGQASLRIIRSNLQANDTIWRLQYVNTSSNVLTGIYEGADTASQFVPVNALFGAALVGASSSSSSSVDAWGNIKIPWIERLNTTWEDAEGWYPIPQLGSSDEYAALIGLPLSIISDSSNSTDNLTTSFDVETSYWTLSCPVFEDLGDGLNATGYYDPIEEANLTRAMTPFLDPSVESIYNTTVPGSGQNLDLYSVSMYDYNQSWDSPVNTRLRHITYMENNNGPAHWVAANCTIRTTGEDEKITSTMLARKLDGF